MPRVAVTKGTDRRATARRSLELIIDDIRRDLGTRRPVIKPNFVSSTNQLASTHVDQVRGVLDVLSRIYHGKILIAEAACYDTGAAFDAFGFRKLPDEYDVELRDLNGATSRTVLIKDRQGKDIPVNVAEVLLDQEHYRISAAKMKTHDTVVVTLSVKNMAVGSIADRCKKAVHQGIGRTNRNIADLAAVVWPHLSVIDGQVGMEGNGPTKGDPVLLGIALASTDALAADRIACDIMGVEFERVGYLQLCARRNLGTADPARIDAVGERVADCVRPFRLHRSVDAQYDWQACRPDL
jgi:uncharacterized protein (DUF362 family)